MLIRRATTLLKSDKTFSLTPFQEKKLYLPEKMRKELKTPLGKLVKGPSSKTIPFLEQEIRKIKPVKFAVVGDYSSKNILRSLEPDIIIIDQKINRKKVELLDQGNRYIIKTENEPGTINEKSWRILQKAITLKSRTAVIVEGEEDLLVLPLISMMPLNSIIVYGQPREGIVIINVTNERKKWVNKFLSRMET
jgi:uncharacterized protein (UPF0218 family)